MAEQSSGPGAEQVLILHGWENRRPEGHWQRWLAEGLEAEGALVRYPQLPDPDCPTPDAWQAALEAELDGLDPARLTVVAHSLGCVLWLEHLRRRAAAGDASPAARRSVLAAPPSSEVLSGEPAIAAFAGLRVDAGLREAIGAAGGELVFVGSEDDPYCPGGAGVAFAQPLGAAFVPVPGGGHLTIEEGFGPFPLVRDLVAEGARRAA
jgi:predicted alpha/beta hydrolase family esterase